MAREDRYYHQAKQLGYRSRAAFKLKQIDEAVDLIGPTDAVVDLGAAPGSWLQVAAEATDGTVVGVDRQRIDPIDGVATIRGDVTAESTVATLRDRVGPGGADVVLSDLAPNMTGEYELDHARSVHLGRVAFEIATDLLAGGGNFVVKVFDGPDVADLRSAIDREFDHVRPVRPAASRAASSEVYLVGLGRLTAPVRAGDRIDLEIVDVGAEGDGVARVDGFTVFVPGARPGETVRARVTEVKDRFGFADPIE